jgi:hypothetical protein
MCLTPPKPPVKPQYLPGREHLGTKPLPRWVKIAATDYDALFRGTQAMGVGGDTGQVGIGGDSDKPACPGNLQRFVVQDEQNKK